MREVRKQWRKKTKQVFELDEVVKLEEENTLDCKALKTTLAGSSGHCSPEAGEFVLKTALHGAGANAPGVAQRSNFRREVPKPHLAATHNAI